MKNSMIFIAIALLLQGCGTTSMKQQDSTVIEASVVDWAQHGLVFSLEGRTHDYDLVQLNIVAPAAMRGTRIEIAVPVAGTGVYEQMNESGQNRIKLLRSIGSPHSSLKLTINSRAFADYFKGKKNGSPAAMIYIMDVEEIASSVQQ